MISKIKNHKLVTIVLSLVLMSSVSGQAFAIECMADGGSWSDCNEICQSPESLPWLPCL